MRSSHNISSNNANTSDYSFDVFFSILLHFLNYGCMCDMCDPKIFQQFVSFFHRFVLYLSHLYCELNRIRGIKCLIEEYIWRCRREKNDTEKSTNESRMRRKYNSIKYWEQRAEATTTITAIQQKVTEQWVELVRIHTDTQAHSHAHTHYTLALVWEHLAHHSQCNFLRCNYGEMWAREQNSDNNNTQRQRNNEQSSGDSCTESLDTVVTAAVRNQK